MPGTVVLQSFRTTDVPPWLTASLRSVQAWSAARGFDYRFLDDAFFDFAPEWVKQRCAGNIYAVTDLCRLEWMLRTLDEGADRVVWADADVLVFDPDALVLDDAADHGFAEEWFLQMAADGSFLPTVGINNALMWFRRDGTILRAYRDLCIERLRALPDGPVPRTALGPALLDELAGRIALRRVGRVGLFTPAILRQVAEGGGYLTRACVDLPGEPPAAANLCHFMRNAQPPANRPGFDQLYNQATSQLLQSRGRVLRGDPAADPRDYRRHMRGGVPA